jgi:alpha-pyrone synthase
MTAAYINKIGTAIPPYESHRRFIDYACCLLSSVRTRQLFRKMAERAQIERSYSFFEPSPDETLSIPIPDEMSLDVEGFYRHGRFPDTSARMRFFERHAPTLAVQALNAIDFHDVKDEVTHLIVGCCTGFYAPGLDIDIVKRFNLKPTVERTIVGFMGCYSAFTGLKLARHIIHSEPRAKVAVVNLEMNSIHLQELDDLEQLLSFLLWGDGCSACLVSNEPSGIELRSFHSTLIEDAADQMTWRIGHNGFDMTLSGKVPMTLARALPKNMAAILGGYSIGEIELWAVHPGGRSILDAVEGAINLDDRALQYSREVLRQFGNMSSPTVPFVLKMMLDKNLSGTGCGMAFGPGLTAESMIFAVA